MKPETQIELIRNTLNDYGKISRNFCLQRFITRLGARIIDLKNEGMDITGKWETYSDGKKDYVYYLKKEGTLNL